MENADIIKKKFDLLYIINAVAPKYEDIALEIEELRKSNPKLNKSELSKKFARKIRNQYTSVGVVTALPSAIPGLGTAAQIAIEGGMISGDLLVMLRGMSKMCYGIGMINEKDMTQGFNQDFIKILGMWSGVIVPLKTATEKIGTKVAFTQFNKHISGKMLQKINKKVGTTILTKYGTKRGGVALGRMIPFGVGAIVGGTFNYTTMKGFSVAAISHYQSDDNQEYIIIE